MTEVDKLYTVRCMVRTLHNKREIQLQWHNYKCSNKGNPDQSITKFESFRQPMFLIAIQ